MMFDKLIFPLASQDTREYNRTVIVLYDGVCRFCNRTVDFIIHRDPGKHFKFAALQSEMARRKISETGTDPSGLLGGTSTGEPPSLVLLENGRLYTRSTAALRISRKLSGLWPLLSVLLLVPRPVRDWVYGLIARNRYHWFGRYEICPLPDPSVRDRFLD